MMVGRTRTAGSQDVGGMAWNRSQASGVRSNVNDMGRTRDEKRGARGWEGPKAQEVGLIRSTRQGVGPMEQGAGLEL